LILGFGFDKWHPGWVVFLLVPVINMIVERKFTPRKIVNVVVIGAFIGISFYLDEWHPTWLILFLIPIINTIFFPYDSFKVKHNSNNWEEKIKKFVNDRVVVNHEQDDDEDF
jgi:predicted membrane metal-binding protein